MMSELNWKERRPDGSSTRASFDAECPTWVTGSTDRRNPGMLGKRKDPSAVHSNAAATGVGPTRHVKTIADGASRLTM